MVFSFHSFSVRLCCTRKYPYTPPPPPRPRFFLLPSTESNENSEEKEGGQKEAIFEGVGVVSRGIFFPGAPVVGKDTFWNYTLMCVNSYVDNFCSFFLAIQR